MLKSCNACGSTNLDQIWNLPAFPLTGVYIENSCVAGFENRFNQELQYCESCSHAQLGNQIDPIFLYRETYTHRTSESPISTAGNRFFLEFINSETVGLNFNQVLEVGCNDLFLLENISCEIRNKSGIDPIWPNGMTEIESGIKLWGGFAESTDYSNLLVDKIDLILTAHTFEHVINPRLAMETLKDYISDDCLLFIEVPSAERMLQQRRMDQVFNQHVNYYSINSLVALFAPYGFELEKSDYNFSYWGGTQLLKFTKKTLNSRRAAPVSSPSKQFYQSAISDFTASMNVTKSQIINVNGMVYAYGAAQMLPVLAYHLGDSFNCLSGIVDDNISRCGKYFPEIDYKIQVLESITNLKNSSILLTALDSARPILKKLLQLETRSIILPLGII